MEKKSYKEYPLVSIGSSDRAALTLVGMEVGGMGAHLLKFGGDGDYRAYLVDEKAEIGWHYSLADVYEHWLNIYDDSGLTFKVHSPGSKFYIYRAGDYGCIIQTVEKEGGLERDNA